MKKIVVLGFGGTISTTYDPVRKTRFPTYTVKEIIEKVDELQLEEIIPVDLGTIDSTEVNESHWTELAQLVHAHVSRPEVAGVVITHGTDTMSFSSAAISLAVQNLGKPVIFTGSQRGIDEPHTDARFNLLNAVSLAKGNLSGVYLSFGGLLIAGTRAAKTRSSSYQAFESINYPYLSPYLVGAPFQTLGHQRMEVNPPLRNDELVPECYPYFETPAHYMDIFPSNPNRLTTFVDYLVSQDYLGLVVKGFGLGNIPSTLTERLTREDVTFPTILSTQCRYEGAELSAYSLGKQAEEAGIISARDMPPETAWVKLKWVLGCLEHVHKLSPPYDRQVVKEEIHRQVAVEIS